MKLKLSRTPQTIQGEIDSLLRQGVKFDVFNGTYTTKIVKPWGNLVLSSVNFPNKVFVAHSMVRRDCLETDLGQEIIAKKHTKFNYANNPTIEEMNCDTLYNIDIKGAYASCLFNNGLVRQKTYQYLMGLPKTARLPCVGMLARSYVHYAYDKGELIDVKPFRAETAELFFYLIAEIDIVMREIKWILGRYFVMYWVDGVFFSKDTPAPLVREVESYLMSLGYNYRYERIDDFMYRNVDGNVRAMFMKNGEFKDMKFRCSGMAEKEIKRALWDKGERSRKKSDKTEETPF